MSPGRVVLLVFGVLVALVGIGLSVGGGGVMWLTAVHGDGDGYLTTPSYEFAAQGHAVTSETADLRVTPDEWAPWTGRFRTRLTLDVPGEAEVFAGIGPAAEVAAYLDGVAHAEVRDLGDDPDDVVLRTVEGARTPEPPGAQDFWAASTSGSGRQSLDWQPSSGRWTAVVMNADGSAGIDVAASGGLRSRLLWPIGVGLLVGGVVLLALATAMIVVATAGRRVDVHAPDGAVTPATPAGGGLYPLSVEGHLDEPLSRGLWLVKWFLAIPHYLVLTVLWTAFMILTVFAGIAIVFTGRYPRAIFDFNVGVLRWSWRVAYYSYSVLGTDRYPPFSLAPADYPATLDVAYPERLSRGLVLVKWWLLAIPHYIVLGLLIGGATGWWLGDRAGDNWQISTSGGAIGLLAVIAGIVLLATARYPRGLFDVTMGLNRWVYRVIAYAALMTDQYPPFRLDAGGSEPQMDPSGPVGPRSGQTSDKELVRP